MKNVIELIEYLKARSVELGLVGENIRFRGPKLALPPEILDEMKSRKAEIISYLNLETAPDGTPLRNSILLGDSQQRLRGVPDNSIDLMVTDPPYGIEFMGNDWDQAVPNETIWAECLRVLKPGSFAFIMCIPRQDLLHRMIVNLESAGFCTAFSSLYWTYASGFPKGTHISKVVDRRAGEQRPILFSEQRMGLAKSAKNLPPGKKQHKICMVPAEPYLHKVTLPVTTEAKKLEGSYAGFQPKPAVEVILVAMKPLLEKAYVDQALSNGKGVTWLDDCRIPYGDERPTIGNRHKFTMGEGYGFKAQWETIGQQLGYPEADWKRLVEQQIHDKGRLPSNLLVSDWVLGEHSKFFDLDRWAEEYLPFIWVPKASRKEKETGLQEASYQISKMDCQQEKDPIDKLNHSRRRNSHPTVKPLKLMAYLVTMASREGDIVLDPFCGSGTTCIAAMRLKRDYIGVEISPEYREIALKRLEHFRRKKAA